MIAKIVSVEFGVDSFGVLTGTDEPKVVKGTFDDGNVVELFSFYSDELSFTEAEFIGLTAVEARKLHFDKDVAWLRS